MKWLALSVWGVIFLVGLAVLYLRTEEPRAGAFAARQLAFNHLIQPQDLQGGSPDRYVGTYLRINMHRGQFLTKEDVSAVPNLFTDSEPWFALSTPITLVRQGSIDVKSKGQICDQGETITNAAEAVALFCPVKEDGRPCLALVRVSSNDVTRLQSLLGSEPFPDKLMFKPTCK
jgi:hypothetical protein